MTAANAAGSATATSASTAAVAAVAPADTTLPAIRGAAVDGQTLTADEGDWSGTTPLAYGYQWQDCDSSGANCQNIAGATQRTYQLTTADVGQTVTVVVAATNQAGSATATSSATGVVQAVAPSVTAAPQVSGTAQDGQTLTASTGAWSGTTPLSYSYQWQSCDQNAADCQDIAGATTSTYELHGSDVGTTLEVVVTAANIVGSSTATSQATAIVTAAPPSNQASPTVAGGLVDGQTLTADTGTWTGNGPIAYAYQWQRCDPTATRCTDIPGATGQAYQLAPADVGETIQVLITATNAGGSVTASSNPSDVIAAAPAPQITDLSHTNLPTGAVTDGTDQVTVTATSQGPGIQSVQITDDQGDQVAQTTNPCDGTQANACPPSQTSTLTVDYARLPLGDRTLTLTVTDAAGLTAQNTWTVQVTVPASCNDTWTGNGRDSEWSDPANWSDGVPGERDYACLGPDSAAQITDYGSYQLGRLHDDGSLSISGGSLSIDDPTTVSQLDDLTLSDRGTLAGASEVDVTGALDWSSSDGHQSVMTGSGTTVIEPGATASLAFSTNFSSGVLYGGRTLENQGDLTVSSGTLAVGNGSVVNDPGATLEIDGDGGGYSGYGAYQPLSGISQDGGPAALINRGTIIKAQGSGTTTIGVAIQNSGTVQALSGTLSLTGGGDASQATASQWIASSGANLSFDQGSFSLGSDVQMTGDVDITGAQVDAQDIQASQGDVSISQNATMSVDDDSTATHVQDLALSDRATLAGAGEVDITSSLDWSSSDGRQSTMSGSGSTVIEPGATATLAFSMDYSSGVLTGGRTLDNQGDLTLSSGSLAVGNASVINEDGATFEIDAEGGGYSGWWAYQPLSGISQDGGPATLINHGTIVKAQGSGTTTIAVPLDNSGTVQALSGTLSLTDGGNGGQETGSNWIAGVGAAISFDQGSFALGSDVQMTGDVDVTGAQVDAQDVQAPQGDLSISGGSLSVDDAATVSQLQNLGLSGRGTLQGAADIDVSGALDWSAGAYQQPAMSGSGSTVIEPGATASLSFGAYYASYGELSGGRTLDNEGDLTLSSGPLDVGDASIVNGHGATFEVDGEGDGGSSWWWGTQPMSGISDLSGQPATFDNQGTLVKAQGSGTTTINAALDNSGTVQALSGTLSLTGGGDASENTSSLWIGGPGAAVSFDGGSFALGSGVQMTGSISVNTPVEANDVQAAQGDISVTGSLSVDDPSTTSSMQDLSLSGNGALVGAGDVDVSGALDWSAGSFQKPSMSGSGSTVIEPGATASLSFGTYYGSYGELSGGRTLDNEGDLTLSSGPLDAGDASIINAAGATFEVDGEGDGGSSWWWGVQPMSGISNMSGQPATLDNQGTLVKAQGSGTTTIDAELDNSGSVQALSGTLSLTGGGDASQTTSSQWVGGPGATVSFDGGTYSLGSDVQMTGGISVNTPVEASDIQAAQGDISVTGSLSVENPSTVSSMQDLTLSGNGALQGAGEVDVTGSLNWSAGAFQKPSMTGSGSTVIEPGATASLSFGTWYGSYGELSGGRTLDNEGDLTLSSGPLDAGNASIINAAGATFEVDGEGDGGSSWWWGFQPMSGISNTTNQPATFDNQGTLLKAEGAGTSTIDASLDNSGTVQALSGTLSLTAGGDASQATSSEWIGAPGAAVSFEQGSFSLGADAQMTGNVEITGAQVDAQDVQAPAGDLSISDGDLSTDDTSTISDVGDLGLSGNGALQGAGEVDVSNSLDWSAGSFQKPSMSGSGSTVIEPGATASLSFGTYYGSYGELSGGRTLDNEGDLTLSSGPLDAGDASIINAAGATFEVDGEGDGGSSWWWGQQPMSGISSLSNQPPTFDNQGTLVKAQGSGTTTIDASLDSSGTVQALSGTLSLTAGGDASQATSSQWVGGPGATVSFDGGTFSLGSDVQMSGEINVTSAQVDADDIQDPGATITVAAGASLNLDKPGRESQLDNLVLAGGQLWAAGQERIYGSLSTSSGAMIGSLDPNKSVELLPDAELGVAQAADPLSLNGITLISDAKVAPTTGEIQALFGATIINDGVWNVDAGLTGSGIFINNGILLKDSAVTDATIDWSFENNGHVVATHGELLFDGGGVNTPTGDLSDDTFACPEAPNPDNGSWEATDGEIDFSDGCWALGAGASLVGDVSVGLSSILEMEGTDAEDANLSIAGTLTSVDEASPAVLGDINLTGSMVGPGSFSLDQNMTWSAGVLGGPGALDIGSGGDLTVATSTSVTQNGLTIANAGSIDWNQGQWTLNGAVLMNNGSFTANAQTGSMDSPADDSVVDNRTNGSITKTAGSGDTEIDVFLANNGSYPTADAGAIHFGGPNLDDGEHDDEADTDLPDTDAYGGSGPGTCSQVPARLVVAPLYAGSDVSLLVAGRIGVECSGGATASMSSRLVASQNLQDQDGNNTTTLQESSCDGQSCVTGLAYAVASASPAFPDGAVDGGYELETPHVSIDPEGATGPAEPIEVAQTWSPPVSVPEIQPDETLQAYLAALASVGLKASVTTLPATDTDTGDGDIAEVTPESGTEVLPTTKVAVAINPPRAKYSEPDKDCETEQPYSGPTGSPGNPPSDESAYSNYQEVAQSPYELGVDPTAGSPPITTVPLRWGTKAWGWTHILTQHSYNAEDEEQTRTALADYPDPLASYPSMQQYLYFSLYNVQAASGESVSCLRTVVVEFGQDPVATRLGVAGMRGVTNSYVGRYLGGLSAFGG